MREVRTPELSEPKGVGWFSKLIDNTVLAFAPQLGARRVIARNWLPRVKRHMESTMSAGSSLSTPSHTRDGRWLGTGSHIDTDYDQSGEEWRARCVELYRDNPIAHGMVESTVTQEIGEGIRPQANIEKDAGLGEDETKFANKKLERLLRAWSRYGSDRTPR